MSTSGTDATEPAVQALPGLRKSVLALDPFGPRGKWVHSEPAAEAQPVVRLLAPGWRSHAITVAEA